MFKMNRTYRNRKISWDIDWSTSYDSQWSSLLVRIRHLPSMYILIFDEIDVQIWVWTKNWSGISNQKTKLTLNLSSKTWVECFESSILKLLFRFIFSWPEKYWVCFFEFVWRFMLFQTFLWETLRQQFWL